MKIKYLNFIIIIFFNQQKEQKEYKQASKFYQILKSKKRLAQK